MFIRNECDATLLAELHQSIRHETRNDLWSGQLIRMVAYVFELDGKPAPFGISDERVHRLAFGDDHPCPAIIGCDWQGPTAIGAGGHSVIIVRRKSFARWVRKHWQELVTTEDEHATFMRRVDDAYNFELQLDLEEDGINQDFPPPTGAVPAEADESDDAREQLHQALSAPIDEEHILDQPIAALGLDEKTTRLLAGAGIETVFQLICWNAESILKIKGIGPAALGRIKAKLAEENLTLRDERN